MKLINAWNHFWFDSNRDDSLYTLALFRIAFYLVMLFFYITRIADVPFYYGNAGIFPAQYAKSLPALQYHPSIFFTHDSTLFLHISHSILLLLLACVVLGLFTRINTVLSFLMHLMFINRNMSAMFGVDMIATFFMLYMCFANSHAYFSLDRLLFKSRAWSKSTIISFVALRLMQIQLCVVYAYSGLEKLKGTRWWDGSALWDVFCMGTMQRWDMSFVSHLPLLLSVGVYIVLFWEIYFPILVWNPKLKNYVLGFGVLMHIGIGIFMNLPSFGAMMISLYILFLSGEEIRHFKIPNHN